MKTLDFFLLDNIKIPHEETIETKLDHLGIKAKVVGKNTGPTVTQYLIDMDPSVPISKLMSRAEDLRVSLGVSSLTVVTPVPGTNLPGIEVPSEERSTISMRDVMQATSYGPLQFALGIDTNGNRIAPSIPELPHLLIGGSTGSGKSVCVNALICSLLAQYNPSDLQLVLMDFKGVELAAYDGLPHLLFPVISEPERAVHALSWLVAQMERRYRTLISSGVRNITQYRDQGNDMPFIVVVIDEMADMMMRHGKNAETYIVRLAQKSRAVGIHLVLATQRPVVSVVTGLIKSNIPSRIAFAVASQMDSRIILDTPGAEALVGKGDMLFIEQGRAHPLRIQGVYVSDEEIARVIDYWKNPE
jgi:DNA segregation ATPase FtsK/SpoIIIE, S-DNA-T family